ncbi:hypothetical protein [Catenulispora pinisilvae]|uniref:hypothetical protein n=1 Tax=Catenulispora pinisilvae TaxID=2705253 RepID=UPI001E6372BB|nr:hypothetical protein [Catenulispora pinisilvae]
MVPPPTGTEDVAASAAPPEPDDEPDVELLPLPDVELLLPAAELVEADEPPAAALVEVPVEPAEAVLLFEEEQPAQTAPTAAAIPKKARRPVPS